MLFGFGARALGQANAFTARASDASAIRHNPAGLVHLAGTQFYIGGSGFHHNPQISSGIFGGTYTSDNGLVMSPHLSVTHRLSERIGLGLSFSALSNYYQNWGDEPSASNPVPRDASYLRIRAYAISPAVALNLGGGFSIGGGLHYVMSSLQLRTWESEGLNDLLSDKTGLPVEPIFVSPLYTLSGNGIAFFGGIQWRVSPNAALGFSYHGGSGLASDGRLEFNLPAIGVAALDAGLAEMFPDQDLTGRIQSTVDQLSFGASIDLGTRIELEADLSLRLWSQLKPWTTTVSRPTSVSGVDVVSDERIEFNWNNAAGIRLGGEYHLGRSYDVRAGIFFDRSPIPGRYLVSVIPDSDRLGVCLGFGYRKNNLLIDIAAARIFSGARDEANVYQFVYDMQLNETRGFLLALSLGWQL